MEDRCKITKTPDFLKEIKGLKLTAKSVYSKLFFTLKGNNAYPSNNYLAEELGCCVSTIQNSLNKLHKQRLIRIGNNDNGKTNKYFYFRT